MPTAVEVKFGEDTVVLYHGDKEIYTVYRDNDPGESVLGFIKSLGIRIVDKKDGHDCTESF
jgi:hypothetical protein